MGKGSVQNECGTSPSVDGIHVLNGSIHTIETGTETALETGIEFGVEIQDLGTE
jgi:hypothetical protein